MARTKGPTAREIQSAAAALSDQYLQCRDVGHSWRIYYQKREGSVVVRKLWCPSCKTNRKTKINRYGEVVANSYDYADGYLLEGFGRIQGRTKSLLRAESINRAPEIDLDYHIFEEPDSINA